MSFTNGHPTRKFRSIQPLKMEEKDDIYLFEGFKIPAPKETESFKSLISKVTKDVMDCRAEGIFEKGLCQFAIDKTRKAVLNIKQLSAIFEGK